VPNPDIFDKFAQIQNLIKEKPPIGYFIQSQQALDDLSTSTPAFTLAGISALGGIFDPLKNGLIMILWFLFCFWIFHRLRNLEL